MGLVERERERERTQMNSNSLLHFLVCDYSDLVQARVDVHLARVGQVPTIEPLNIKAIQMRIGWTVAIKWVKLG
jgi:hypothetical protein